MNDESCKDDVEDELVPVLDDTWNDKRHEIFRCAQKYSSPFLINRGFGPLTPSYEYPCSSQSFPGDRTAGVSSSICTVSKRPRL